MLKGITEDKSAMLSNSSAGVYLRLLLEVLHGVQLSCVGVHVLFLGVHVGLGHLLPHGVVLAVQVADAVHGPRLAAPWVGTPLRVNAHVLHCAAP